MLLYQPISSYRIGNGALASKYDMRASSIIASNGLLVANGFTLLSLIMIVQLNDRKLVGLLIRAIHIHMIFITMRHFLRLPKFIMFVYFFFFFFSFRLLISISHFFNWMSKIYFYMETYTRKLI
jgi:hypothetical protein